MHDDLSSFAQCMQIALDDEGSFMLVEDESDRVMPSRRAVMDAGRYDLHHAIQYHGGYTQVAYPCRDGKDPTAFLYEPLTN